MKRRYNRIMYSKTWSKYFWLSLAGLLMVLIHTHKEEM